MTTNHIDQLTEWWENSEQGEAAPGDWIITHGPDDTNPAYIVEQAPRYPLSSKRQPYRILARAPKPKPAWHDAFAVIAHTDNNGSQVWERCGGHWDGTAGDEARNEDLRDVTPLIEAKVTDEMVHAALTAYYGDPFTQEDQYSDEEQADMRNALTAALGLETA